MPPRLARNHRVDPTPAYDAAASVSVAPGARPRARIVVLGYPNPFPSAVPALSRCRRWFADDDFRWLSQSTAALNDAVRAATISSNARVTYLHPSGFEGHDACSAVPWFNGLELLPLRTRYSFHPNAPGQRRLARIVLEAL